MVKQVIVMRKDLNMRKGKMVAQGAHASLKVIMDRFSEDDGKNFVIRYYNRKYLNEWLQGKFTKICLSVDSAEELCAIYNECNKQGIPCSMIVDAGLTEFHGNPTKTCIGIGPFDAEEIDKITGHLKLL